MTEEKTTKTPKLELVGIVKEVGRGGNGDRSGKIDDKTNWWESGAFGLKVNTFGLVKAGLGIRNSFSQAMSDCESLPRFPIKSL